MPDLPYDFSDPFAAVRLVRSDGTIFPFWTTGWSEKLPVSLAIVTEISVDIQLAYLPSISVTLSPPVQDMSALVDSPLFEWGESTLEVQLGYVGGAAGPMLSPVFSGLLLKPDISFGEDPTITLQARGLHPDLAKAGRGRGFNGKTRLEIIEELVKGHDTANPRDLEVIPDENLSSAERKALMEDKDFSVSPGWATDWFLIWRLVRESQCWFYQLGKKIIIVSKSGRLMGTPKFLFQWYPGNTWGPGKDIGTFPILSFTSPSMGALWLPTIGRQWGLWAKGIKSEDGEAYIKNVGDAEATPTRGGCGSAGPPDAKTTPGPNKQTADGGAPASTDQPTSLWETQARAEFVSAQERNMGLKVEIESLGVPNLLPGDVVKLGGLGERISGACNHYAVFTVRHVWGGGGASTSFTAVSNVEKMMEKTTEPAGNTGTMDYKGTGTDSSTAQAGGGNS